MLLHQQLLVRFDINLWMYINDLISEKHRLSKNIYTSPCLTTSIVLVVVFSPPPIDGVRKKTKGCVC